MIRGVALIAVVALLVAACGDTSGPLATGTPPAAPTGSAESTPTAGSTVDPGPSDTPSAEPSVGSTPVPSATDAPSASPSQSPDPNATPGPPPEAACAGTDDNRAFFASAATVLSWDVYCAVLEAGWFLQTGQYRQAGGGLVELVYRGPGGRTLQLREGHFCAEPEGCVPSGSAIGDAPFGNRVGTLVSADDGSWAVTVDATVPPSWLAIGTGMTEAELRALTAALHRIDL
ncbi:MAG: hypothetical protein AABZ33_10400 [Chloroflexota bacterium]